MKTATVFICLLLFSTFSLSAKKNTYQGYYINYQDDTVMCNFLFAEGKGLGGLEKVFYEMQWRIEYIDANGGEHLTTPQYIKSYVVFFEEDTMTYVVRRNDLEIQPLVLFAYKPDSIFLKLIIDGRLKMYEYYNYINNGPGHIGVGETRVGFGGGRTNVGFGGNGYSPARYCFQHDSRAIFIIRKAFYKKDWPYYISDYPELAAKIKNGEYADDEKGIVIAYNEWKRKRNP